MNNQDLQQFFFSHLTKQQQKIIIDNLDKICDNNIDVENKAIKNLKECGISKPNDEEKNNSKERIANGVCRG